MFKVWAKTSVSRRKTKHDRAIRKVTLSSFTLSLGLLSPPLSSLSMVSAKYVRTFLLKCQYEMLQLSTKCSAFNAQGSRLIIVVVQVRAVKIYVAAVETIRKKERQDETQFPTN
jgi:hypothetical protein